MSYESLAESYRMTAKALRRYGITLTETYGELTPKDLEFIKAYLRIAALRIADDLDDKADRLSVESGP